MILPFYFAQKGITNNIEINYKAASLPLTSYRAQCFPGIPFQPKYDMLFLGFFPYL